MTTRALLDADTQAAIARPGLTALIQAAGSGQRLGRGPKAFVELAGQTLLERAVGVVSGLVDEIVVAVPAGTLERSEDLPGLRRTRGLSLIAGGSTRSETTRRLIDRAGGEFVLIHDVVHPFVTTVLALEVLEAARSGGAATAASTLQEFAHHADGRLAGVPGGLSVTRKPLACRRELLLAAYAAFDEGRLPGVDHERGVVELVFAIGARWTFVASPADNLKLTSLDDLRLARRLTACP